MGWGGDTERALKMLIEEENPFEDVNFRVVQNYRAVAKGKIIFYLCLVLSLELRISFLQNAHSAFMKYSICNVLGRKSSYFKLGVWIQAGIMLS